MSSLPILCHESVDTIRLCVEIALEIQRILKGKKTQLNSPLIRRSLLTCTPGVETKKQS